MKVLLTGASGFVGSHLLDSLRARNLPVAALLRSHSIPRFLQPHLPHVQVRLGALDDSASLQGALADITHVIHCAGATKALRADGFMRVNRDGTRNLVEAVNRCGGQVQKFIHISSLAAAGPALPDQPAREGDDPRPVSEYGKSKLAGEAEVTRQCRVPFVIVRPPAVYGPRDGEFLRLFQMARAHLRLRLLGGPRALSLVFVRDLAEAVVSLLERPAACGQVYYAANPEVVTPTQLSQEIAAQLGVWTIPLAVPAVLLWPVCLAQEGLARLSGKPSVLSLQKYAELRAPGWVCDPGRMQRELGLACPTRLKEGAAQTLAWYRQEAWL